MAGAQENWVRMYFKANKAYVLCGPDGRPLVEGGRVQVRYKPDDERTYRASAANLRPLDDPPPPGARPPPAARARPAWPQAQPAKSAAAPAVAPAGDEPIEIYTDGACSGNPGPAAAGVVLRCGDYRRELSRFLGQGTSNIAELTAIRLALEAIRDRRRLIRLHTDSDYALGVVRGDYRAKANRDLVARLRRLLAGFPRLELVKVEAHAGLAENERADALARQELKRAARSPAAGAAGEEE